MSEPTGTGMGRPSGPGFTGPSLSDPSLSGPSLSGPLPGPLPTDRQAPTASTPGPRRRPLAPPPSRLPAVLTVIAIGVVAAIVVVASVLAARQDVREATPQPPVRVNSAGPTTTDRIAFTTRSGSGVLEIVDHAWDSDGTAVGSPGSLLTIAVRVTCESGTLRYGPDSFQAFDRHGELFDPEVLPDAASSLDFGILSAGQQVNGTVAFDIPRGGVTLLMTDESSRTVTALKVPD